MGGMRQSLTKSWDHIPYPLQSVNNLLKELSMRSCNNQDYSDGTPYRRQAQRRNVREGIQSLAIALNGRDQGAKLPPHKPHLPVFRIIAIEVIGTGVYVFECRVAKEILFRWVEVA